MADENFNNFTGQQPDTNPAQNPQEWQNTTPVNDAQPSQNEQANFQAAQQPDFQQEVTSSLITSSLIISSPIISSIIRLLISSFIRLISLLRSKRQA